MKLSFQTRALLMADLTEHRRGIESQRAPQFRHPPGWTTHGFRTTLGAADFMLRRAVGKGGRGAPYVRRNWPPAPSRGQRGNIKNP
ncbi:hypothetical protein VUR80DRAFT_9542 [Thermomyces stellatus]